MSKKNRVNVFLDTTVFEGEFFYFDSKRFNTLVSLVEHGAVRVLLTDVTSREIEAHIHERVVRAINQLSELKESRDVRILQHFDEEFAAIFAKHSKADCGEALKKRFHEFCEKLKVRVIKTEGVSVAPVLDRYFAGEPPFGVGRQIREFPDAISSAALHSWAAEKKRSVHIVSNDGHWEKLAAANGSSYSKQLSDFLALFPDPAEVESVTKNLTQSNVLRSVLLEEFRELDFVLQDTEGEVDDFENIAVEIQAVTVTDGEYGKWSIEVCANVSYTAKVIFDAYGIGWDSEEDEYMDMVRGRGKVDDWVEINATADLEFDPKMPEKMKISNVDMGRFTVLVDVSELLERFG